VGFGYIGIFIFAMVIGFATQSWVKRTYATNAGLPTANGMSGAQIARAMLDANGLGSVGIERIGGSLSDHYDPTANVLRLSADVHDGRNVAAAGVAAHEAGHAVQHARGFVFARFRMALVPVANIGSQAAPFLIIVGLVIGGAATFLGSALLNLGILFFAGAVLFQIVTLPVEFDASRRALATLSEGGYLAPDEVPGARSVLTAAAMTYVAATLISVMYLLYYLGLSGRD
jgi:Zn-dependent membrane protease YugP